MADAVIYPPPGTTFQSAHGDYSLDMMHVQKIWTSTVALFSSMASADARHRSARRCCDR